MAAPAPAATGVAEPAGVAVAAAMGVDAIGLGVGVAGTVGMAVGTTVDSCVGVVARDTECRGGWLNSSLRARRPWRRDRRRAPGPLIATGGQCERTL